MKNMDTLKSTFDKQIEEIRRIGHKEFAIGIVTKGISLTQFKGVTVRENETSLMAKDSKQFQSQVYGKAFTEVHRIFVDYTIDLLNEIIKILATSKKYDDIAYKKVRERAYNDIGISILPSKDIGGITVNEIRNRLNDLGNNRHLIEHNNGIVDKLYLQRNPSTNYKFGERIDMGPEQIGEAIALVETLAEDLNKRVLEKFFPYLSH